MEPDRLWGWGTRKESRPLLLLAGGEWGRIIHIAPGALSYIAPVANPQLRPPALSLHPRNHVRWHLERDPLLPRHERPQRLLTLLPDPPDLILRQLHAHQWQPAQDARP